MTMPTEQIRDPGLVTIRRFRDLPGALLAKSVLESADIECFLADDIIVRMDWFWSYAVGEVKVRVLDTDTAASDEILKLNESPPEFIEFGGIEPYAQARCPSCQSFDVWHDELLRAAYVTLLLLWFLDVPSIPFRRRGWTCHGCGHCWSGG